MRYFLGVAAVSGFLAVAFGAFGAHGLKEVLPDSLMFAYQTGVQYHFYHTFALMLTVLLFKESSATQYRAAAWLFSVGIVLFAGSLYVMAITGTRWLGVVTPIGGVCFLGAWLCLGWAAIRDVKSIS